MKPNPRVSVGWLILIWSLLLQAACVRNVFNTDLQLPLVQNSGFSAGLNESGIPAGWRSFNDSSVLQFSVIPNGIAMTANTESRSGIFQVIPLKPKTYYRIEAKLADSMYNSREIGFYAENITDSSLIAKWKLGNADNLIRGKLIFNSDNNDSIRLFIGGPEGFAGKIMLDSISIKPIRYEAKPYNSPLGKFLYDHISLNFDNEHFDEAVQNLSVYLNQLYLDSSYSSDLKKMAGLISPKEGYQYYSGYLQQMDLVKTAYCQRISLSLGEVLQNEFGIPVQQVHMNNGQVGIHQFIQYWHPFRKEWVAIDPYYGFFYQNDGKKLNAGEVQGQSAAEELVSYSTVCFDHNRNELIDLWQTTSLEFGGIDLLSYPVGDMYVRYP